MDKTAIQIQDLHKDFGAVYAVQGITFDVRAGETFSLLGPNGAGKTTTISMLCGLLKPSAGDAIVAGHSITKAPMAARRTIGMVPQEIALYETLTARQNLYFWGRMYDMGRRDLRRRVDEVLEQIGLADRANDSVKNYSGGMKRRLNIGAGLLHRPQIIFMDEPTAGIDPQSRRNILDMVKQLTTQGMTVLYTTHYMEEAEELSDRVGIIDHGKLIALGTQKELTQMVGEHETLRLYLAEGEGTDELAAAFKALPEVVQTSATEDQLVLMVSAAAESLAGVITHANALGLRIRSVTIEEPNLEAVFLHLTGRALRD